MDGCHRLRAGEFVGVPTFSRNLMNRTDFSRARISKGKLFVFTPLQASLPLPASPPRLSLRILFPGSTENFVNETEIFSNSKNYLINLINPYLISKRVCLCIVFSVLCTFTSLHFLHLSFYILLLLLSSLLLYDNYFQLSIHIFDISSINILLV